MFDIFIKSSVILIILQDRRKLCARMLPDKETYITGLFQKMETILESIAGF
jgi:hypothetical protein